ncbi:MAG: histidinol-phosphatase [Armatimonadota bacterium]|nr:histidinol-phosphatase [Armatimonadota bacterium]MDR5702581.1 histidinol-phosphatase [Armatimonadota bacterium]
MSYHNHLHYCDGSGTAVEYAEAAIAAGLDSLGLSCHAPVPFPSEWNMSLESLPAYCAEVRAAQEMYRGRLQILLGVELDYLSLDLVPQSTAFQQHIFSHHLDYVIASVHFVGRDPSGAPWTIDWTEESFSHQLEAVYRGDIQALVEEYYRHVVAMAEVAPQWGLPVIVGHLDKIKMWNFQGRYFPEDAPWYKASVETALQAIREAGLVLEINTAGLRTEHGEPYPAPWILRRSFELGIPVTISSDAHTPDDVVAQFPEALALLRDVGYTSVAVLDGRHWNLKPLP